jgi:hypothetical protein
MNSLACPLKVEFSFFQMGPCERIFAFVEILRHMPKKAQSWFEHFYAILHAEAKYEHLYLVTGVDKCTNRCLASYSGVEESAEMKLRFTPTQATVGAATRAYTYSKSGPIMARSCHSFSEDLPGTKPYSSVVIDCWVRDYRLLITNILFVSLQCIEHLVVTI